MAKKIGFFILTFFLLLPLISFIQAEELQVHVIVEQANVRLKPDLNSMVISKIPLGAVLQVLKKTGEWYHINLPRDERGFVVQGYIHRSVVQEIGDRPVEKPVVKPEPIPVPKKDVRKEPERYVPPPPPPLPERKISSLKKIAFGLRAGYGGSGIMFGGGLNFLLMKNLGICIEGLYFSYSNEGSSELLSDRKLSKGKTTILPIQLSIQGRFPVSPQITPYITAGAGYYLSSFALDSTIESDWDTLGFTIEETIDSTFGFHGGAGLDYFLNDSIAINLDARYIFLKPKGTWKITDQISSTMTSGEIDPINLNSIMVGFGFKFFF